MKYRGDLLVSLMETSTIPRTPGDGLLPSSVSRAEELTLLRDTNEKLGPGLPRYAVPGH